MGSVSTLSQILHLLLSPYIFRSIQSQAQANFTRSSALTPQPPILLDRHLSERSLPSANSTLLLPLLPPTQWERLDTVNFKGLVQLGKFTVKVKGYAKKKSATRGCFIWLRPPRHPPPSPMLPKKEIINHVFVRH